jgi:hypothetical protein
MEDLARETFEKLAAEGISVSPVDAVRLDEAARRLRLSRDEDGSPFLYAPRVRMVGGVLFHEPTAQSELWLLEVADAIAANGDTRFWLRAFALAHADEPGFFDRAEMRDSQKVSAAARAFQRSLAATEAEVVDALFYCIQGEERDAEPTGPKARKRIEKSEATRRDQVWDALSRGIGTTGAPLDDLKRLTVPTIYRAVERAIELRHGRGKPSASPAALATWNELLMELRKKGVAK